jgi:hypothetical protein
MYTEEYTPTKGKENIWVCAICGSSETRGCRHSKDKRHYALIRKTDYRAAQEVMRKSKLRFNNPMR